MEREDLIGVATRKAAWIVGVSTQRLAAWDTHGLVSPGVSEPGASRMVRVYSVDDLVEAVIVKTLERRGHSLRQIHRVMKAHRSEEAPRPLKHLKWATDAGKIYVQYADGSWYGGRHPRQGVIPDVIDLDEIRATVCERALERVGEPGRVERRKGVMSNRPVFAGTRTPVEAVHTYMRRDIPDSEILEAFPHLEPDDLETARRLLPA